MFEQSRLENVLTKYKKHFLGAHWGKEKFKWEAIQTFQENWDVNAEDFPEMLTLALSKTFNLLASMNNFPAKVITGFAKIATEDVRGMFINLFDETKDVYERIDAFKMQAKILLEKHGDEANQHYQHENAITTYLWLRYPDKYYIYKYSEVKAVADELESDFNVKRGAYEENIRNFLNLYDDISEFLKQDEELVNLLQSQLTDTCYPDPELKTLTIDVGFYISRIYSQEDEIAWIPKDYTPGLTVEEWVELLKDPAVFDESSLQIMKRMKDYGGMATCKQLSLSYGESINFYNRGSSALARRIAKKTDCPTLQTDDEKEKWWPILYLGRTADKDEEGSFVWKLRDELAEALNQVALHDVELYAVKVTDEEDPLELYTKKDFLEEVYMTEQRYDNLVGVLKNKKNIILQGAPGVGKTFAAKRLAYSIMGVKDENRIEFIQFHQNYSYEDFVMGYKPVEDGFELKHGVFYKFCQKATNQPDQDFFFIIDEINRGNMSKILGELLMLIERDYRGEKATLAYNGLPFFVPENIYIIGLMNTADRSLAMIDYALRRRFSFFEMEPGFSSEGFIKYQKSLNNEILDELIDKIKELNKEIIKDNMLGKGFCIGHSYFCGQDVYSEEWLRSVVEYDIIPMISEYWFDDEKTLQRWGNILYGVFQ